MIKKITLRLLFFSCFGIFNGCFGADVAVGKGTEFGVPAIKGVTQDETFAQSTGSLYSAASTQPLRRSDSGLSVATSAASEDAPVWRPADAVSPSPSELRRLGIPLPAGDWTDNLGPDDVNFHRARLADLVSYEIDPTDRRTEIAVEREKANAAAKKDLEELNAKYDAEGKPRAATTAVAQPGPRTRPVSPPPAPVGGTVAAAQRLSWAPVPMPAPASAGSTVAAPQRPSLAPVQTPAPARTPTQDEINAAGRAGLAALRARSVAPSSGGIDAAERERAILMDSLEKLVDKLREETVQAVRPSQGATSRSDETLQRARKIVGNTFQKALNEGAEQVRRGNIDQALDAAEKASRLHSILTRKENPATTASREQGLVQVVDLLEKANNMEMDARRAGSAAAAAAEEDAAPVALEKAAERAAVAARTRDLALAEAQRAAADARATAITAATSADAAAAAADVAERARVTADYHKPAGGKDAIVTEAGAAQADAAATEAVARAARDGATAAAAAEAAKAANDRSKALRLEAVRANRAARTAAADESMRKLERNRRANGGN